MTVLFGEEAVTMATHMETQEASRPIKGEILHRSPSSHSLSLSLRFLLPPPVFDFLLYSMYAFNFTIFA
jgi:hypothetical protein